MATYSGILDSETDPDAPMTSSLAKRWSENYLSIFENDATAISAGVVPHGIWTPDTTAGTGGLLWDHAVSGTTAIITAPSFVAGYDYRFVFVDVARTSAGNLEIEAQRVSDRSWDTFNDLTNGNNMSLDLTFPSPLVEKRNHLCQYFYSAGNNSSNPNANAGVAGSFFYRGATDSYKTMRFDMSSGSFGGGKVYMYRSKSLTS